MSPKALSATKTQRQRDQPYEKDTTQIQKITKICQNSLWLERTVNSCIFASFESPKADLEVETFSTITNTIFEPT